MFIRRRNSVVNLLGNLAIRWRKRFSRSVELPEHLRLGARGEKLARHFLRRNGYKILYRNFRGRRGGEVDIVCRDADTLAFVEVKTRTGEEFGRPAGRGQRREAKANRARRAGVATDVG